MGVFFTGGTNLCFAGQVYEIKIDGKNFEPAQLQAWPGDRIRICNQSDYRRQPFTHEKYNRFGKRTSDILEMLKKGDCKEVTLQNPTGKPLKVTIRDAIAEKAKLIVQIWQAGSTK